MSRGRSAAKHALRRAFELGQHAGVDVLPRHFYSSNPDMRALRRDQSWRAPYSMHGLQGAAIDEQLSFVRSCRDEQLHDPIALWQQACQEIGGVGYGPIDGAVLYGFITSRRPERVIQIGAGVATSIILRAARQVGYHPQIRCVDPFPSAILRSWDGKGEIELITSPAQELGIADYAGLQPGDLLFVDSTHTVKPGSEVNRLILEILPQLSAEVYVHFHDVLFPYDYSPTLLGDDLFFWNESVLLHAFLCFNEVWRLRASMSMIHHQAPARAQQVLPGYQPAPFTDGIIDSPSRGSQFPSSAYLQRFAAKSSSGTLTA